MVTSIGDNGWVPDSAEVSRVIAAAKKRIMSGSLPEPQKWAQFLGYITGVQAEVENVSLEALDGVAPFLSDQEAEA